MITRESTHTGLLYCDFVDPNADPRIYQEVEDIDKLKLVVNDFLEEHNAESKSPMPLVMFLDAIEHVLRIARILRQPQGNALLLGVGGSGRQSMSKMATYISGYELFQVEIAKVSDSASNADRFLNLKFASMAFSWSHVTVTPSRRL